MIKWESYDPEKEPEYTGRHGTPRDVLVAINYVLTFQWHYRVIDGEEVVNPDYCRREIDDLYRELYHPRGLMAGVNMADKIKKNRRIWGDRVIR